MALALLDRRLLETGSTPKMPPIPAITPNAAFLFMEPPKVCSDPSILPSHEVSKRIKDLWWLHGHPHSKRYSDPELISLGALVKNAGQVYNRQTAFLYPLSAESATPYQSMTWGEFDAATEKIALAYAYEFKTEIGRANATQKQPTIALLGAGRTLEYFCTEMSLQKLGLRVLLLAESNSQDGLHHLLESCEVLAVITDLHNSGTDTNGIRKVPMIDVVPHDLDIPNTNISDIKFQDFGDVWERHTFIIHSSGSTGMPKPIIHTNRSMMLIARMYRLFQDFSIENWFLLFPLYHIAGISIALSGLPNGQILSFPPLASPTPSSYLFTAWQTLSSMGHPVDCVHCAPMLIENMYEHILEGVGDFTPLASLKLLQPGGAVLSDSIIKDLVDHGVNVKSTYGSTEIGPPFRSIPASSNKRCYAFRNLYPDNPFLKMEQVGDGLYECVVYKGFELAADLWAGKHDDEPFRTNDLFTQEPPESNFYVLQGRRDDILVHSNGENTSAGPLQLDIRAASKAVKNVLAIGHSLPSVGLLVELYEGLNRQGGEAEKLVWKAVEEVNNRYPNHSQISRNMIYILPRGSSLEVTPKGNVKRRKTQRHYADEIARLYNLDISPCDAGQTSTEPLSEFLRKLFSQVSKVPVTNIHDSTTIFDLGVESRLALSIRCSLSKRLGKSVSLNTIFEMPSISQLVSNFEPSPSSNADIILPSTQVMSRMISKLVSEFKTWGSRPATTFYPSVEGETILLTGCTGSLGTALLEALSSIPNVAKIYAMTRGPDHADKLRDSLERRGIDPVILSGNRIQALNFSMQDPLLGLDVDTYYTLAKSVTMVVHNAWKVDFNIGVEEFEGDCIRSTMSLLRFCSAGRPKKMTFISSTTSCLGPGQSSDIIPESPVGNETSLAASTGYAQSKYIVERITKIASQLNTLHIPIRIIRAGQLCGSMRTGVWNTSDMYPNLFATSFHPLMRCLPTFTIRSVDWVPVDVAASCISELLLPQVKTTKNIKGKQKPSQNIQDRDGEVEESPYAVHNIVNPHPIPWSSLLSIVQSSIPDGPLEEIPISEWVGRLTSLADEGITGTELPGLRLLGFFERLAGEEGGKAVMALDTTKTRDLSPALRECGPVSGEWINSTLNVWRKSGFVGI